ncbi:MAG: GH3 auxin-responsive promoter family protein [Crocinitomicaceae bacterium]
MGVLGTIVKTAFEINQKLHFASDDPKEQQEEQLIDLLKTAKDTAFGKYYGFESILNSSDILETYRKNVPIHTYKRMRFWWDQQQLLPDISWPGKPDYFALTSGTTGKSSKRIPVTEDFAESMKKVGLSLARNLPNFNLPEEVFESRVLVLGSSADLKQHENGHLEGEISGINFNNFSDWYKFIYAPGKEINAIDDWEKRLERIVEEAPNWNIGSIAGIPSWVLLMLKAIMERYELENIQEIWPNFQVYVSGGVAFETYRKDFEEISNKELIIIDTYLASEGFFAYSDHPDSLDMTLAIAHGYFYEFIPFDERGINEQGEILDDPEIVELNEVEENQEYVLVISTCAGAWRYVVGDTIKFTQLSPYKITLTGRLKFFLNVVGSQLSEEKLDKGILELSEYFEISINEYMVAALKDKNGNYYHQWCVVCDEELNEEKAADYLDETLQNLNKNYRIERSKALKDVRLKQVFKKSYSDFLEEKKKMGGQVKIPKVIKAEKMREFIDFVD